MSGYERLQAMDDAYWGERARQALEGGLAGTDETMRRLQERMMLRLNLTNAALSFPDDLPGKQFKQLVNAIFKKNLIVAKQGLPFDVALPNEETKASMLDVRARKNLETITLEQLQREIGTQ